MLNVGLHYLSLSRPAPTLSGGEGQRIRLASQLGCGLVGVLYILDEPSIGLHARDQRTLLETLFQLRDLGNTVLVVEHDAETMLSADWIIDLGPGAGVMGGEVVAEGTPEQIMANPESLTGRYLSGALQVTGPNGGTRREPARLADSLRGAPVQPEAIVTARFPLGVFTCVTGVSGSGKSSLVTETLFPALQRALALGAQTTPGPARPPGRPRAARQGHRHHPGPHRAHPALEPGHLRGRLRRHPPGLCQHARGAHARLHVGPFQLQRQGRALRSLRRARPEADRDALPAGCLGDLPGVQGRALQPAHPGGYLQGQEHRRGAGHGRRQEALEFFSAFP